ncbi:hypothetical protein LUX02_22895 [Streptomyces somaliensis]|nr:hypothetical protein [Streptomyces somaliensis]
MSGAPGPGSHQIPGRRCEPLRATAAPPAPAGATLVTTSWGSGTSRPTATAALPAAVSGRVRSSSSLTPPSFQARKAPRPSWATARSSRSAPSRPAATDRPVMPPSGARSARSRAANSRSASLRSHNRRASGEKAATHGSPSATGTAAAASRSARRTTTASRRLRGPRRSTASPAVAAHVADAERGGRLLHGDQDGRRHPVGIDEVRREPVARPHRGRLGERRAVRGARGAQEQRAGGGGSQRADGGVDVAPVRAAQQDGVAVAFAPARPGGATAYGSPSPAGSPAGAAVTGAGPVPAGEATVTATADPSWSQHPR